MVQVLERPEVKERAVETLPREAPRVRPEPRRPEAKIRRPTPKRPVRWMRWLFLGAVLVFGAGVALVVTHDQGKQATTPTTPVVTQAHDYRTADGWDRYLSARSMGTLDYRTADGWQRQALSAVSMGTLDYRTADGWDRHLTAISMGTLDYRTADGFERVVASLQPVMTDHRTADGWERYLDQLATLRAALLAK